MRSERTISTNESRRIDGFVNETAQFLSILQPLFLQQLEMFDWRLIAGIHQHNVCCLNNVWNQICSLHSQSQLSLSSHDKTEIIT